MSRFLFITTISFWKISYYVFLFLHVYGNLVLIIYTSFVALCKLNLKKIMLYADFIFFVVFYLYVLW